MRDRRLYLVGVSVAAGVFLLGVTGAFAPGEDARMNPFVEGWGVDACLTAHVPLDAIPGYLERVGEANLRYLRERGVGDFESADNWETGQLAGYRLLRDAGYDPVAFESVRGRQLKPRDEWNVLPEDLLEVYRAARAMSQAVGSVVSIWEMVGEPDTFFCQDLPDRVAAYQKAVYLGIKDGASAGGIPAVMMGALGLYPSPWLERAARNGMFDYTDALNVHYYGHAEDFRGMLRAHREVAHRFVRDRELPIWVTECGLDAVPFDAKDDAHGRELQAAFTVRTAEIALEEGVRVFMPFILAWPRGHEFALLKPDTSAHPAWTAYAEFTRQQSLDRGPGFAAPKNPSRVVVQWLPDNATCYPHKVSGSYQFRDGAGRKRRPMRGELVVYNFSDHVVRGLLVLESPIARRLNDSGGVAIGVSERKIRLSPFSSHSIPVEWLPPAAERFREPVDVRFISDSGRDSARSYFELESIPAADAFGLREAIRGNWPDANEVDYIWAPELPVVNAGCGPWLALNGVRVVSKMNAEAASSRTGKLAQSWEFSVLEAQRDPKFPPMAVTKVNGLPRVKDGALRVRMNRSAAEGPLARIDLVDRDGQRFTIGENLGANRFRDPSSTLILAYEDFHLYAFGRVTNTKFQPDEIREIQVRLYGTPTDAPLEIRLDVLGGGEN